MAKEEILLDLNVDQGSMITELERSKKSIIQLREEQQKLTKAYKEGAVTVDEYASESVRLEAILKKEQQTYNNTQKAVTGVKTSMDKLIDSNKQLASEVKIGGTSIADLTTKITALANPVTSAVGVVTALGAAYARSTIGAKDLEFASNQLSIATTLLADKFAGLFSSADDGEGFFSKLTNALIAQIDLSTAVQSNIAALAKERLEDLQTESEIVQSKIQERLSQNAELLNEISSTETSIQEKQRAALQIQDNLSDNAKERLDVIDREITQYQVLASVTQDRGPLERIINKLKAEQAAITTQEIKGREKIEKLLRGQVNAEQKLREETEKKIQAQNEEEARRRSRFDDTSFDPSRPDAEFDPQEQLDKDKQAIDELLGIVVTAEDQKRAELIRTDLEKERLHKLDIERNKKTIEQTKENFFALADLFSQGSEARKVFALAGLSVDTGEAIGHLTEASEGNPLNLLTGGTAGIVQFTTGLIRILANIAAAKQFIGGTFAGGGDFVTTKPTLLMVGDNPGGRERVTVEPLSGRGKSSYNPRSGLVRMAGGGSLTFDGASASANSSITQALATSNAIKRMPRPVVGVKQIVTEMERVEVKQTVSRV